jgi:hypothetical protein
MLSFYAGGMLSPVELLGSLLDSFTAGREAAELAADPPVVQEQLRAFLDGFRPDPLPPVFAFGRITAEEAARRYRERQGKHAALLAALGLGSPSGAGGTAAPGAAERGRSAPEGTR